MTIEPETAMAGAMLFDETAIARHRRRASRQPVAGAEFLLRTVAEELAERLGAVERHFPVCAELHGYSGIVAEAARRTGKIDRIVRVETDDALAAPHADTAIAAALETVPFEAGSLDLILSPLSLHLTNDTPGALIQMCRALKPDGLLLAALPGAGTLGELRTALIQAESELTGGVAQRVVPFADVRDAGALLQRAGFALPVADVEAYTARYDDMFALMRDLRGMAMQNPLLARSRKPLPRAVLLRAAEIYAERFSDADGRIRATFTIVYLSGWRPHESQQKPLKPGSAAVSLAALLDESEKTGR